MKYTFTIEIEMENIEAAARLYSYFIGVPRKELINVRDGFTLSGSAEPNLFTLMRPATVKMTPLKETT